MLEIKEILIGNLTESLKQSQRFIVIAFGASVFAVLLAFGTPGDIKTPIGPAEILISKSAAMALSLAVFWMAGLIASVGVLRVKTIIAFIADPDLMIAFLTYPSILTIQPRFLRHVATLAPPILAVAALWQMFGKQLLGGTWQFVGILLLAVAPHLGLAFGLYEAVGESVQKERAIARVCAKEKTATGAPITRENCSIVGANDLYFVMFVRAKTEDEESYFLVAHGRDTVRKLTLEERRVFGLAG